MRNEPDFEKFLEYYKWVDDSMLQMIKQFIPASADLVDGNLNVVESHILERNKYQHQYPSTGSTNTRKRSTKREVLENFVIRGAEDMLPFHNYNLATACGGIRGQKNTQPQSVQVKASDRQDLFIAIRDARLEELNKAAFLQQRI